MRRFLQYFCVFLLGFLVYERVQPPIPVTPWSYWVMAEKRVEYAVASYYGDENDGLLGKMTASGCILTQNMLIAAHKSLPFGTLLRVTNLSNGRSVVVTVADRGPYVRGRDLDLSAAAALAIDLKVGKVRIAYLESSLVENYNW